MSCVYMSIVNEIGSVHELQQSLPRPLCRVPCSRPPPPPPVPQDTLDLETVRHTCTPMLQTAAHVLLAVADIQLKGLQPKPEPEYVDGVPAEAYRTQPNQYTCLRVANKLLMALHIACYITDPHLAILTRSARQGCPCGNPQGAF